MRVMKLIVIFSAVTLLSGVCSASNKEKDEPVYYKFEYGVHDPQTNDVKTHWEHRDGHTVKGEYMMKEADGTIRIVQYTADPHAGFQATVKKEGHAQHPVHYGQPDHGHSKTSGTSHVGITRYGDYH